MMEGGRDRRMEGRKGGKEQRAEGKEGPQALK